MSRAAAAISKPHRVAVLRHFLFDSRREDCPDIVGTDSGAVGRPNKALQCAGYIQGNKTRVARRQGGIGSTKHARAAEGFRTQTEALSGSAGPSYPIDEATAVQTAPVGDRR